MASTVHVDFPGLADWYKKLGMRVHSTIRVGLLAATQKAIPIMQEATTSAPPANPMGIGSSAGAVATGKYLRAWKASRVTRFGSYGMRVYNTKAPYNAVIEYGRRAGAKPPPIAPLTAWAQLKLGLPYKAARRFAFGAAKNIGRRGLRPRHVLTSKNTLTQLGDVLRQEVLAALNAAVRSP